MPALPAYHDAFVEALHTLTPDGDYARGVLDVLALLGLVQPAADGPAAPTGEVAAMLLGSLRAHLADGVPVGFAWDDLDAEGVRGADVLRAIEAARLAAVGESASPGRVVSVVQAVIKAEQGGAARYLFQYDAHARRYQPIGGKQDPGDASPEAALRREIAEELELPAAPTEAEAPLRRLGEVWRTRELSATYGVLTAYEMRVYAVEAAGFPIRADADTRWLTRAEIAAEVAADGRAVSPVYQQALGGLAALDALPAVLSLPAD